MTVFFCVILYIIFLAFAACVVMLMMLAEIMIQVVHGKPSKVGFYIRNR